MSWTCKREAMYMLVYKHVENDHTGVRRRITSLISFRRRNYLQFFTFWIFFNPTNYANLYLTIYSFILECSQYQNYGLRLNKRDLFTITAYGFVGYFIV